jgi:hypothetical protein
VEGRITVSIFPYLLAFSQATHAFAHGCPHDYCSEFHVMRFRSKGRYGVASNRWGSRISTVGPGGRCRCIRCRDLFSSVTGMKREG